MGKLFGSDTKTTEQPYEDNPWGPQQDYLKDGFEAAKGALATGQNAQAVAGLTNRQKNFIRQGTKSANNNRKTLSEMFSGGMNTYGTYQDQAGSVIDGLKGSTSGIGAGALGYYNGANVGDGLDSNTLQSIYESANQHANSDEVQGLIDSSLTDVTNAFERTRGGINSSASGTGNINSTRAGVLESRALDDAMDRSAQISSQIRSDAFSEGINTGLANNSQNASNAAQRGQLALQAGGLSMDRDLAQFGAGADVAGLLSGLSEQGYRQGVDGFTMGMDNEQFGLAMASLPQEQRQRVLDAARMGDMEMVQAYMQAIGGNYGSEGFQTTVSKDPSIFQQVVGGGASILGGLSKF